MAAVDAGRLLGIERDQRCYVQAATPDVPALVAGSDLPWSTRRRGRPGRRWSATRPASITDSSRGWRSAPTASRTTCRVVVRACRPMLLVLNGSGRGATSAGMAAGRAAGRRSHVDGRQRALGAAALLQGLQGRRAPLLTQAGSRWATCLVGLSSMPGAWCRARGAVRLQRPAATTRTCPGGAGRSPRRVGRVSRRPAGRVAVVVGAGVRAGGRRRRRRGHRQVRRARQATDDLRRAMPSTTACRAAVYDVAVGGIGDRQCRRSSVAPTTPTTESAPRGRAWDAVAVPSPARPSLHGRPGLHSSSPAYISVRGASCPTWICPGWVACHVRRRASAREPVPMRAGRRMDRPIRRRCHGATTR